MDNTQLKSLYDKSLEINKKGMSAFELFYIFIHAIMFSGVICSGVALDIFPIEHKETVFKYFYFFLGGTITLTLIHITIVILSKKKKKNIIKSMGFDKDSFVHFKDIAKAEIEDKFQLLSPEITLYLNNLCDHHFDDKKLKTYKFLEREAPSYFHYELKQIFKKVENYEDIKSFIK